MKKIEIDWESVHYLTLKYSRHLEGYCEEENLKGISHGNRIGYDSEGKLIDNRCAEQVEITNEIVEMTFQYMEIIAKSLLKGSFKMPTPQGRKIMQIRKNNSGFLEDLVQEGAIEVCRTLKNYNLKRKRESVKKSNYIMAFISYNAAGAMIGYAHKDTLIKIPQNKWINGNRAKDDSEKDYLDRIVANIMNSNFTNIDGTPYKESDNGRNNGKWQDRNLFDLSISAEERLTLESRKNKVDAVLETLSENEREIIRMRFGFYGEEYTLKEISEKYKLTGERIRQIEEKALKRLKHPSRAKELRNYL